MARMRRNMVGWGLVVLVLGGVACNTTTAPSLVPAASVGGPATGGGFAIDAESAGAALDAGVSRQIAELRRFLAPFHSLDRAIEFGYDAPARRRPTPRPRRKCGIMNGIVCAMITTIDTAGRVVIPSEIRREAALEPGTPLDVRWEDGLIEIEPLPLPVTLRRKGRLLVAAPKQRVPPMRTSAVERTRQRLAERRGRR